MKGIDITDILRLRRLAAELEWHRWRMLAQNNLARASISGAIGQDARAEADDLQRKLGISPGEI